MDDLEITRLCAEAMGLTLVNRYLFKNAHGQQAEFTPLHDDAQAMALVKKLGLDIHCRADMNGWYVGRGRLHEGLTTNADLNRAICVATADIPSAVPVYNSLISNKSANQHQANVTILGTQICQR